MAQANAEERVQITRILFKIWNTEQKGEILQVIKWFSNFFAFKDKGRNEKERATHFSVSEHTEKRNGL